MQSIRLVSNSFILVAFVFHHFMLVVLDLRSRIFSHKFSWMLTLFSTPGFAFERHFHLDPFVFGSTRFVVPLRGVAYFKQHHEIFIFFNFQLV